MAHHSTILSQLLKLVPRQALGDEQDNPIPVFDAYIRENKSLFGTPGYGVPVVLTNQNPGAYRNVVNELEEFASEFQRRLDV